MASLALIVSLIFLAVLLIGPLSILVSHIRFIPNFIAYLFGILSIVVGMWWFLLPTTGIRYLGIIPVFCGYYVINHRKTKNSQSNLTNEKG